MNIQKVLDDKRKLESEVKKIDDIFQKLSKEDNQTISFTPLLIVTGYGLIDVVMNRSTCIEALRSTLYKHQGELIRLQKIIDKANLSIQEN